MLDFAQTGKLTRDLPDAISRGDAQWQEIEAAVAWGKGASADDLFDLAAQI